MIREEEAVLAEADSVAVEALVAAEEASEDVAELEGGSKALLPQSKPSLSSPTLAKERSSALCRASVCHSSPEPSTTRTSK